MENAIPTRIAQWIKQYPPFDKMEEQQLVSLAETAKVKYFDKEDIVFNQGDEPSSFIYVVREGAVRIVKYLDDSQNLVDTCDEGDLFGLRPLLANETYQLSAIASEESLLYLFRIDRLQDIISTDPEVSWYLLQSYAAGPKKAKKEKIGTHATYLNEGDHLTEIQSLDRSKAPITCSQQTTAQDAAIKMSEHRVGSIIIVDEEKRPLGIITDRDLRNLVVTGKYGLDAEVGDFMTSPVITVSRDITLADVQMIMMKNRIHHLCITEDGTSMSPVMGVISEHDVLVIQGNNPAIFIREMRRAQTSSDLKKIREKAESLLFKYLKREVSIGFISNIMSEVNDALISRAIEICQKKLEGQGKEDPGLKWSWMALGSEGREEQLLRTDQDNALVFEDVNEDKYDEVKAYYLKLAQEVTQVLNECGFEYCPADMMASNPKWCMSISGWKDQFARWMQTPTEKNVMYCTIFFDFRVVFGDPSLSEALADHIFDLIDDNFLFLVQLAKNAIMNPPPLTFFRNFVVEKGGEHKDDFDIKARAMMPLADAARILVLSAKKPNINNTFQRFDYMATIEPNNKELYEQAADAYEILMRYRAIQGLKNNNSGRYFNPEDLTKMERLNLRNSFKPINELHDLLKVRYRLNLVL